ncbi:unnamed protein product [Arctogadus glacialis]
MDFCEGSLPVLSLHASGLHVNTQQACSTRGGSGTVTCVLVLYSIILPLVVSLICHREEQNGSLHPPLGFWTAGGHRQGF